MHVKVMTYNIQHGLDYLKLLNKERFIDLDKICNIIKDENPDIIGLNEVYNDIDNLKTTNQAKYIADKLGYPYFYFGKSILLKNNIEYGNAIISKYPIEKSIIRKIDDPVVKDENVYYESRIIIENNIKINDEIIKVLVTHFGLAKSEQNLATQKLLSLINDNNKYIVVGDFNMEEDNENIIKIKKVLNDSTYLLETNKLTFPSLNPKIKIDYIFTKKIKMESFKVIQKISSDHFPCVLIISI